MRQRSLVAPVLLMVAGAVFLVNNLRPNLSLWEGLVRAWPFLLIGLGVLRLVEVLYLANRGETIPRGANTSGQLGWILGVSLALYAISNANHTFPFRNLQFNGMRFIGEEFDYPVQASGDAQGVTMLVLDNLRGNVTVTGVDGSHYSAQGHKSVRAYSQTEAERLANKTQIRFVREGSQLVVRAEEKTAIDARGLSADMEITIPRGVSVEARGRSGDLTLNSLAGTVDVESDRGDIRLSEIGGNARVAVAHNGLFRAVGLKGNLDVEGRGSDVQLEDIQGQVSIRGSYSGTLEFKNLAQPLNFESDRTSLRIGRVAGTFNMDLGDIRAEHLIGPVRLKTRSRDVHIEDFTDAMDIEIERGDIELTPAKLPLARIDVRSQNGNVDLTLPERADFDLHANTRQGEATNEYGTGVRAEVEGRSASLTSTLPRGAAITVNTGRGTVSVKKS